jgi:hypothetical protein
MEHRQDDLERRFAGEFGMRVDRDAAAVVAHGDGVVDAELDLDAAGMAGNRFVHRIVDDLGGEMMERALVGAADIHAGAPAYRLQPLQDLDVLCRIARCVLAGEIIEEISHGDIIGTHTRSRQAAYSMTARRCPQHMVDFVHVQ